jgi:hypothetical protein
MRIADLASAAGICPKQTHTALLKLRNRGLLTVISKRGQTSRFSLPSVSLPPVPGRTTSATPAHAPAPPQSSRVAPRQPLPPPMPAVTPAELPPSASKPGRTATPQTPAPTAVERPVSTAGDRPISRQDSALPQRPLTPEQPSELEECRQLASKLMGGRAVDDSTLENLNAAIQHQSPTPGALLRRLTRIKELGGRELSLERLIESVIMLHQF